jgi:hypothetical protein
MFCVERVPTLTYVIIRKKTYGYYGRSRNW